MALQPTINILLVDDHPENLIALEAILGGLGQNLVKATSGQEALRRLLHQDFAVILLDVQMPGMDGFETASLIRQRERSCNTPIIFLTAFNTSDELMEKGYALGAVDYLFKPIQPSILATKVTAFVELFKKTLKVEQQAAQLAAVNAELQQSEERFRLLSRCSPIGIFLMNTQGEYTYANPSCQAICGFTVQENWKTDWMSHIYTADAEKVLRDWPDLVQQGQPYSDEFRLVNPDGSLRWVHVRTAPMLSDTGQLLGHVGTIEDITDRKQAEAARDQIILEQAARQQAENANRMKDEFLAIVSHELRTPLNSILGWSQLLLNRQFDQTTITRALATIERNARSQAQLIEDILDVSQIIRGRLRLTMQPIRLIPLVEAVIDIIRPSADEKAIQMTFEVDDPVDRIYGDAERLKQVIWNLLSNAVKFTPHHGKVTIRLRRAVRNLELHPRQLMPLYDHFDGLDSECNFQSDKIELAKASEYAELQITDTGIGISPEFLPHVFDRFRQADSTSTRLHGGLGLGLAIVYHLVRQHYGVVWANSPGENQGATFTLHLPLLPHLQSAVESLNGSTAFHPDGLNCLNQTLLLVVEDHDDTREYLTLVLQQAGAEVIAVASAKEALQVLEQTQPRVLISDIGMPLEDGYSLIHAVRSQEKNQHHPIRAIALTAHTRAEDQAKALAAGFELHLSKPIDPEALVTAVAQAVDGLPREKKAAQ
jgi:PAS domain S-box-containing protein